MKDQIKKILAVALIFSASCSLAGCGQPKKEPRPTQNEVAEIDEGNADASKDGDGQSDAPLIIGCSGVQKNFNPFDVKNESDGQVVELTQISLFGTDRSDRLVYKGINGELRNYEDKNYTYYGVADMSIDYDKKKDETTYQIKLRDDLVFSDGEKITIDDVLFSMYVLCDNDYRGTEILGDMPVKGLLNYQADSSAAEKFSEKKVKKYIKKMPGKLRSWIDRQIIHRELKQGMRHCETNYTEQGYSSAQEYFKAKYQVKGAGDSEDALLKKAEEMYQKKGYQALAEAAYQDKGYFDEQVGKQSRIFLSAGKGKRVKNISGIQKINDYEMKVVTDGYSRVMSSAFQFPVCALHYYGDTSKFNVAKNKFGFHRGDISAVLANRSTPMGAGPYRFVKYESGVIYLTSNELYYLGCPEIAFVQIKEMSDILKETGRQLRISAQEAQEEQEQPDASEGAAPASTPPIETPFPVAKGMELKEGTVDVIEGRFGNDDLLWLSMQNSNEKLYGNVLSAQFQGNGEYGYIGIHAGNVRVGETGAGKKSRRLRTGLAVVFSAARDALMQDKYHAVQILQYPAAADSWISPSLNDAGYEKAFSRNVDGTPLSENPGQEENSQIAAEAALCYFQKAGYTVDEGKITKAPKGAFKEFSILVPGGKDNTLYPVVEKAGQILEMIGIRLKIVKVRGGDELSRILHQGKQQLWVGARSLEDMDLEARYTTDAPQNVFGVQSKKLDDKIALLQTKMASSKRRKIYLKCYDLLEKQAVEVPVCEERKMVLFSTNRIERETIPADSTQYYSWLNEIQNMKMK